MEKNKVFYSVNFLNSVEEIKGVKLNGFQKTILSLFNNEGIFYLNSNVIKILNTNKKSLVYKLNNLIKMGIIFKVETNVYQFVYNISKKFDKHNGFYIECNLFKNSNLSPYTVILYSFFKVFEKDGFLMNTKTIDKYLGFSKLTLYNSIDSLKENGLIKIEKSKFKNRFKYFVLPYTIEGEEQEDEQIERLNDRLDKAGEVVKQQQEIINQQQEQINQLKKSLTIYIDKFNKIDKVFQPILDCIDEQMRYIDTLYQETENKKNEFECKCNIKDIRNILARL